MMRREKLHARADLDVVADPYRRAVEKDAVEIDEEIGAGGEVVAVVAAERRLDRGAGADGFEQGLQQRGAPRLLVVCGRVVSAEEIAGAAALGYQRRVVAEIELAGEHLLLFRHAHARLAPQVGQFGSFGTAMRRTRVPSASYISSVADRLSPLPRLSFIT